MLLHPACCAPTYVCNAMWLASMTSGLVFQILGLREAGIRQVATAQTNGAYRKARLGCQACLLLTPSDGWDNASVRRTPSKQAPTKQTNGVLLKKYFAVRCRRQQQNSRRVAHRNPGTVALHYWLTSRYSGHLVVNRGDPIRFQESCHQDIETHVKAHATTAAHELHCKVHC